MASQANSGSDLGFEADLFKAADKLRGNLELKRPGFPGGYLA